MKSTKVLSFVACGLFSFLSAFSGWAAEYPAPREGNWVARDFRFHTSEVLPELKLSYLTIGDSSGGFAATGGARGQVKLPRQRIQLRKYGNGVLSIDDSRANL